MINTPFSIMIVDDHPIIHDGLKMLLTDDEKLKVVATTKSASETMEVLKDVTPDLAIVDLSLGDSDGTYLIQRINRRHPKLKIIVYTMSEEKLFAERAENAGASGYVMKTSGPTELKKAIHTVLEGGLYFSSDIKANILKKRDGKRVTRKTPLDLLSNREMDVFRLVGRGMDSISISEKLKISRNTVDTHRINIKNKLNLETGKALDRAAFQFVQYGKFKS